MPKSSSASDTPQPLISRGMRMHSDATSDTLCIAPERTLIFPHTPTRIPPWAVKYPCFSSSSKA